MRATQALGLYGEELAARHLTEAGLVVLERNWRCAYGEIDIVARDGRTLVFIEVKGARQNTQFGPEKPILSIDFNKQRRVRRLATAWMSERREQPPYEEIRFDAVGVTLDRSGRPVDVDYVKGAF